VKNLIIHGNLDFDMSRIEKALAQFATGCNCCQSITTAFGPDYNLGSQKALKIGAAFGGGISRRGDTCGAVSGALMIIGLVFRNDNPEDSDNKERVYEIGQKFLDQFMEIHGTVMCRDLIGIDLNDELDLEKASEAGIFENKCPNFVKTAAQLLEDILEQ
jgi:C_GCAxxG_C_C family probable redox protein